MTLDPRGTEPLILAIDQGTTNAKALVVAPDGLVVSIASCPVPVAFPRPGWVEQDAEQLLSATVSAATECLARAGEPALLGIAISTQRESAVAWSAASGRALGPVLGWQDARTAERCQELALEHGVEVTRRTGLSVDPMYSAPKMRWLFDAAINDGADPDDIRLGTVDAWLCWRLTGEFATEAGNASRTLLFDLASLDWSSDLLRVFGIPEQALPVIRPSNARFGVTTGEYGLPANTPVMAMMADSHAAMYAQGCTAPGQAKATYGTGSSIMTPAPGLTGETPAGLTTTLAWLTDRPTYAFEGNILASGAALDWMSGILALEGGGSQLSELAASVSSANGVTLVPAFSGLGAPHWDRDAVGLISGIGSATTRAHLARAAIECVAHQVADVVSAAESGSGQPIHELCADGGATTSRVLMQVQADLLDKPIRVAGIAEASALGVAMLAFATAGLGDGLNQHGTEGTYSPSLPAAEREEQRRQWANAVARARLRDMPSASPTLVHA